VVKRPNNENLHTIGEVFADKGYEPIYLYGGYGYFDNMEQFFGSNGYTVVDRKAIRRPTSTTRTSGGWPTRTSSR